MKILHTLLLVAFLLPFSATADEWTTITPEEFEQTYVGTTIKGEANNNQYKETYNKDGSIKGIWKLNTYYRAYWRAPKDGEDCGTIMYKERGKSYECWALQKNEAGDLRWVSPDGRENEATLLGAD